MPIDPFSDFGTIPDSPYSNALKVTPSDTEDLPVIPRGVLSRTGGRVRVTFMNGETVELRLQQGEVHRYRVTRIFETAENPDEQGAYADGLYILW